jgi:hypothetical protein
VEENPGGRQIESPNYEEKIMGYMRHHAIVVTGVHYDSMGANNIKTAHAKAASIFKWVSPLSPVCMNGFQSFFIPPDGRKEGWDESDEGDRERRCFISYLESIKYEDGSSPVDWIEVQFGDDDWKTMVVHDSDEKRRDLAVTKLAVAAGKLPDGKRKSKGK